MRCFWRSAVGSLACLVVCFARCRPADFRRRCFRGPLRLTASRLAGRRIGGFLARFLGHTPSFRRFRRINHGVLRGPVEASRNGAGCWASLMASEYGYKEFDALPIPSLNVLFGPDDE